MIIKSLVDLKDVNTARFVNLTGEVSDRLISLDEFEHLFRLFDAFWKYEGEPRPEQPHALLRSGEHSDGFINCMAVLEHANLCDFLAHQLVLRLHDDPGYEINLVVDAAYSGSDLGHSIALHLPGTFWARHRTVEKDKDGNPTIFRGTVDPDERVLVTNELMTTPNGSTQMAKDAVIKVGARPDQFVRKALLLVNRSYEFDTLFDGTEVVCIGRYHWRNFNVAKGEVCPYCEAGSPPCKPKQDDNWSHYFSGKK